MVETSPGRFQTIWLVKLDELLSPRDAGAINTTIALEYGADPQAKDVARCVRLPGFPHRKGDPFLVRVVGGCKRRHSAAALREAFPAPPEPARPTYESVIDADNEEPYRRQAVHDLEQAAFTLSDLNDNRRNMVFSMACQLAKYVSHRCLARAKSGRHSEGRQRRTARSQSTVRASSMTPSPAHSSSDRRIACRLSRAYSGRQWRDQYCHPPCPPRQPRQRMA